MAQTSPGLQAEPSPEFGSLQVTLGSAMVMAILPNCLKRRA